MLLATDLFPAVFFLICFGYSVSLKVNLVKWGIATVNYAYLKRTFTNFVPFFLHICCKAPASIYV